VEPGGQGPLVFLPLSEVSPSPSCPWALSPQHLRVASSCGKQDKITAGVGVGRVCQRGLDVCRSALTIAMMVRKSRGSREIWGRTISSRWWALAYQESARVVSDPSEDSDSLATSGEGLRCRATQKSPPGHAEQQHHARHLHGDGRSPPAISPAVRSETEGTYDATG